MPNDPKLTNLFGSMDDAPGVDVQQVLRRSRRRRLPRQLAAGGVFTLAIGGVVVAGAQGLGASQQASTVAGSASDQSAEQSAESAPMVDDSGASTLATGGASTEDVKRAPADRLNLCTGPLAEVAPNERGLELTTRFDDAAAGADTVTGTVTLTNNGTETVTGSSPSWVAITLSQDNIVLWHTNGGHDASAVLIDLAPGESLEYEASFAPVICGVDDDLAEGFPLDLPAAPAGDYQVSAAMDIVIDSNAELVTGPAATVTLN
jgi:hypothetical protein